MKKRFTLICLMSCLFLALTAQEPGNEKTRYVMRSTTFGMGSSNIYDSYLSPLEYKGLELRISSERMHMTHLLKDNVSRQSFFNINFSRTENVSGSGIMYYGMFSWSYALHYQFHVAKGLKLLAGPFIDLNAGFIFNRRNSNNPAQGKAYGSIGASGMAIYKFHIKRYPMVARYQLDLPLVGLAFSPEYGQSYYEIFNVGHSNSVVHFTSLHNSPSMRHTLTFDFPIRKAVLRIGYMADIRQFKLSGLRSHAYSNNFMIGYVRNIYRLKGKNKVSMPEKYTPF